VSTAELQLRVNARRNLDKVWATAQRYRALWPAAGLVVATVIAYQFTLSSLYDYLRLDTPLAYLPLLPLFTIGIALTAARRYQEAAAPIADRQVDLIVGVPLIIVAILMITILPDLASTYYWTDRPDVLSLALFVSAGVIILYGVNWFWRIRAAIVFLVLMWPALYIHIMPGLMQSFTDWTNRTLASVVGHLPLGATTDGSGLVYLHQAGQAPLTVSVGSACSGANSVLGFGLVGAALLVTNQGRRRNKLAWFVLGLGLVFLLNVARLTSILALAAAGHPTLALGAYHAVIGLVLFTIAVIVMMWLMPRFGLRPKDPVAAKPAQENAAPRPARRRSRARLTIRYASVALVVGFVALADHELQPYAAFLDGTGNPTVLQFGSSQLLPNGVQVQHVSNYPWAQQYFGSNSSFDRFSVSGTGAGVVWADVVRTDDKGSLDAYSLQNCFLFHNYDIRTAKRLELGSGVVGLLLNYSDSSTHAKWTTVSWAWPIRYQGETYYERVALTSDLAPGTGATPDFQPADGLHTFIVDLLNRTSGGTDDPTVRDLYKAADAKLQAAAAELVTSSVKGAGG
jgi:exosortase/archaeosortase family protein